MHYDKLHILIDNPDSWFWEYVPGLESALKKFTDDVSIYRHASEVENGDVLFVLSCDRILKKEDLKKHLHNIVIHESDLPKGRGWSPWSWEVERGAKQLTLTLFEAVEELDAGLWYLKRSIDLDGIELIDSLREKIATTQIEMIKTFLSSLLPANAQNGEPSFYSKRDLGNQELDIDKTIKEQFNKLRVCDNDRYPAHFFIDTGGGESKNLFSKYIERKSEFVFMRYLKFDSEFFEKPSFSIDLKKSSFLPENDKIVGEFQEFFYDSFLSLKADADDDTSKLIYLQTLGIYYVDTEIILDFCDGELETQIEIEEIKDTNILDSNTFNGVFSHSRFHQDSNIPKEKADGLWKCYLENFKVTDRNRLYVAHERDDQCGYIGVHIENKHANLFAVAVGERYQNKGIGSRMIRAVTNVLIREGLSVGTEVYSRNRAAVSFYMKNGFKKIQDFRYVYHRY